MGKLCNIFNFATLYRQPIYQLIDKNFDCHWYFGENTGDIKGMPIDAVKVSNSVASKKIVGPLSWQFGIGKLIRNKHYSKFLVTGDPMVLSTWWVLLQSRLFFPKKRVYLWSHGWYGREGFAKKWLKRAFFGLADHVFTYGEYARQEAIKQGFNPNKITPIHNSLNHSLQVELRQTLQPSGIFREHFGNDHPTLIFIGRLTKVKRLDMLLDAIKLLKDKGEQYNLTLIGNGEERTKLEAQVKALELDAQVWFYGACYDDHQNADLIYNADLCVAPGNVGLTAMHTMVFGTPVISHDDFKWQMPEFEAIRPGATGAFFKRDNVQSLAEEITRWFATHPNREDVRQACYHEIDTNWTPEYQITVLRQQM